MAETVKIVIDADDKASKEIQGVHGALDKLGNIAKGVLAGGAAVAAAAVYGLGNALWDSVQAAMDAQAAQAQLAQVIKSTGGVAGISTDDINNWATALSNATAVEDDAIVAASSMLLTFTKINKDAFPRALELTLDMSRAFGQDLQASVLQLGKALNDPIEGLGALQRIGVQFSESQVALIKTLMGVNEQLDVLAKAANKARGALPDLQRDLDVAKLKLQEMEASGKKSASQLLAQKNKVEELQEKIRLAQNTLKDYDEAQKSANTSMSEGERIAKAQGVVMDELARQVGGSAEAFGDTLAGKIENLKNKFGDLKERVGTALIPAIDTLVTELGPKLIEWGDEFARWVETDGAKAITDLVDGFLKLKPEFDGWVEVIKDFLKDNAADLLEFWDFLQESIRDVESAIKDVQKWWTDVTAAIQTAIDKLKEFFSTSASGAGGGGSGAGGPPGAYGRGGTYTPPPPPPGGRGYSMPITVNVNIAGNADPRTTRGAVLDALSLARARGMV